MKPERLMKPEFRNKHVFDYAKALATPTHSTYLAASRELYKGTPKGVPAPRSITTKASVTARDQGGYRYVAYDNAYGMAFDVFRIDSDNMIEFLIGPDEIRKYDLGVNLTHLLAATSIAEVKSYWDTPRKGKGLYLLRSPYGVSGPTSIMYKGLKISPETGQFINPITLPAAKALVSIGPDNKSHSVAASILRNRTAAMHTRYQAAMKMGMFEDIDKKLAKRGSYAETPAFAGVEEGDMKPIVTELRSRTISREFYTYLLCLTKAVYYWGNFVGNSNQPRFMKEVFYARIIRQNRTSLLKGFGYVPGVPPKYSTLEAAVDHLVKEITP